ncbi:hypothetical protein AWZ03_011781 [Drosophila navojoa]|uniref:Uncharacterized protein n=1 Tax=Drosophila navojoa TaxID=7232 RepID=A0A484B0P2_DRONA|nr:hypothetical protein AWZ03_011781 [Drosophila navojoa]
MRKFLLRKHVGEKLRSILVWVGIRHARPAEKMSLWRWTMATLSDIWEVTWEALQDQNKLELSVGLLAITASCFFIYTAFKLRR